jgi:hypothetical protein
MSISVADLDAPVTRYQRALGFTEGNLIELIQPAS